MHSGCFNVSVVVHMFKHVYKTFNRVEDCRIALYFVETVIAAVVKVYFIPH